MSSMTSDEQCDGLIYNEASGRISHVGDFVMYRSGCDFVMSTPDLDEVKCQVVYIVCYLLIEVITTLKGV